MSHFVPKNADFEARVRASFARQGAMALIGAKLTHVAPGAVDVDEDFRAELSQQHGFFHGGIVGTSAESACGNCAITLMTDHATIGTVEYKMNLRASVD